MKIWMYLMVGLLLVSCKKDELKWDLDKIERLPSVKTTEVSNISNVSAQVTGLLEGDGHASVTEKGFCYGLTSNPDYEGKKIWVDSSSETGSFLGRIDSLVLNTTYYVRAFAKNKVGVAYGAELTFTTTNIVANLPTVATGSMSNISTLSAVGSGSVSSDGGSAVTARGICYSTNPNASIAGNYSSAGSGIGAFTVALTTLSANTTYYVRACATNAVGTAYGDEISFTTAIEANLASISTSGVSNLSSTAATTGGSISSDGGSAITLRGVCYWTSQNPTTANLYVASGSGSGQFETVLSNLSAGTTYYARAFAVNAAGTAYGNQVIFATPAVAGLATLSTTSVTNIGSTSAQTGGTITNTGGSTITARGVCYSTNPSPTVSNSTVSAGSGSGQFTATLSGLSPNTTYYVRAYATNAAGTSYGNQLSFSTDVSVVQVGSMNCSSLSGITSSYVYWNGTAYTNTPWVVNANGYVNSCIKADNPNLTGGDALGGYIQFSRQFSSNGYITFWVNTPNPGYPNVIPGVFVDGVQQSAPTVIGGTTSSSGWVQLKTANISAGNPIIKFNWPQQGQFYYYSVDEIEFYEYQ